MGEMKPGSTVTTPLMPRTMLAKFGLMSTMLARAPVDTAPLAAVAAVRNRMAAYLSQPEKAKPRTHTAWPMLPGTWQQAAAGLVAVRAKGVSSRGWRGMYATLIAYLQAESSGCLHFGSVQGGMTTRLPRIRSLPELERGKGGKCQERKRGGYLHIAVAILRTLVRDMRPLLSKWSPMVEKTTAKSMRQSCGSPESSPVWNREGKRKRGGSRFKARP